ncbi:hypothetical protein Cabys_2835 [Caldithrix abyssi DSM 13497]|uniref:Uncharacterized protein n=1 Tax=Caldithrix abyssi DSM 13497 TaxID=880073 RepID=A0A1J1CA85_CALAY|nr:hypothetical protein Cabys_2835 [Caldithrix abyssi DSM 13497]
MTAGWTVIPAGPGESRNPLQSGRDSHSGRAQREPESLAKLRGFPLAQE